MNFSHFISAISLPRERKKCIRLSSEHGVKSNERRLNGWMKWREEWIRLLQKHKWHWRCTQTFTRTHVDVFIKEILISYANWRYARRSFQFDNIIDRRKTRDEENSKEPTNLSESFWVKSILLWLHFRSINNEKSFFHYFISFERFSFFTFFASFSFSLSISHIRLFAVGESIELFSSKFSIIDKRIDSNERITIVEWNEKK